jgi:hypothetical protein
MALGIQDLATASVALPRPPAPIVRSGEGRIPWPPSYGSRAGWRGETRTPDPCPTSTRVSSRLQQRRAGGSRSREAAAKLLPPSNTAPEKKGRKAGCPRGERRRFAASSSVVDSRPPPLLLLAGKPWGRGRRRRPRGWEGWLPPVRASEPPMTHRAEPRAHS